MSRLSVIDLGERFERAVAHALAHARTRRRVTGGPFLAHLFAACATVLENGGSESEAIAALLRDLPPGDFGQDVAEIVCCCRDDSLEGESATGTDSTLAWYDRKAAYVARIAALPRSSDAARFVGAALELDNARALRDRFASDATAFAPLVGKKFGTLWAYRALVDAYGVRGGRHVGFIAELNDIVAALAGKSVTTHELLAAFLIDDTVAEEIKGTLRAKVGSA